MKLYVILCTLRAERTQFTLESNVVCDRRVSLFLNDLWLLINISLSKLQLCGDILAQRWPKGSSLYLNLPLLFPMEHALRNTKLKMLGKLTSQKKKTERTKKSQPLHIFVCLGRLLKSSYEVLQGKKNPRVTFSLFPVHLQEADRILTAQMKALLKYSYQRGSFHTF